MKKYITILIILFIAVSRIYSQSTFSKIFPGLGDNLKGHQVLVMPDNNYLSACYSSEELHIIKINTVGEIIWDMPITDDYPSSVKSFPISSTSDNGIAAVTSKESKGFDNVHVVKLNTSGEIQWTYTADDTVNIYGTSIAESEDGFLILGGMKAFNFLYVRLYKIDLAGNFLWAKDFNIVNTSLMGYNLLKLNDNEFLISGSKSLIKIDSGGNEIWNHDFSYTIFSTNITNDNKIVVGGSNIIEILNPDGTSANTWPVSGNVTHIYSTNDNGYAFVLNDSQFEKFDEDGNSLWLRELWGDVNYINQTTDGDFLLTGSLANLFWLLKTDSEGNFKAINIIHPALNAEVKMFTPYTVDFLVSDVDLINIDFSVNGGVSWEEVVSGYPATQGEYTWGVINPGISNNCLLRITDSSDPLVSTVSGVFSIIHDRDNYNYIAANEIKMWVGNDGLGSHDPFEDASGLFWPGGDNSTIGAVFADGFCYGGKINNELRVGGSTYRYGWQAGSILSPGQAADPNDPKYKIYKIKNGWQSLPDGYQKDYLEYDYNNWPGDLGAPYDDVNGDGIFTPGTDLPKFIGDETLFMISNDLDPERTNYLYGSPPLGLEIQTTVFGFDRDDVMKDVVYKKYTVINKSGLDITDLYFTYWSDPDLGRSNDDFAGCDINLNLGYCYNGDNNDENYYGENPPALGYKLIEGPKPNSKQSNDNLEMTSFYLYICAVSQYYCNPPLGVYQGTIEFYNNMQGLNNDGTDLIDVVSGLATKYAVSGDPVAGYGWYEGNGWPNGFYPGDRYFTLSSGPFNMAPGDTQTVVYAIMLARGTDNINSVAKLKELAQDAQDFYDTGFITSTENNETVITSFELKQNYPNPFNPVTIIEYSVPSPEKVTLKIYDILGRVVETIVDKEQKPGTYKVEFNGSKLASGVYFYQLKNGSFVQTKKMILVK